MKSNITNIAKPTYYKSREVQIMTGLNRIQLADLINRGILVALKINSRTKFYSKTSVDALVKKLNFENIEG